MAYLEIQLDLTSTCMSRASIASFPLSYMAGKHILKFPNIVREGDWNVNPRAAELTLPFPQ